MLNVIAGDACPSRYAVIGLVTLIGGRIIPSFTHNCLVKQTSNRLPVPFGRYDMVALTGGGVALVLWIAMPTWREPLVLVLHVGYAFVPLGFLLVGAGTLWPSIIPASAALHAWTAGTMGVMTLAVMTRATLGHTGRALTATGATRAIYVAVVLAALGRIAAPFFGNLSLTVLTVAAGAWTTAFAGFVVAYEPMLLTSRRVAG